MKRTQWSREEIDFLRDVYPKEGSVGFRKRFPKRSVFSVRWKALTLGIKNLNSFLYTGWSEKEIKFLKEYYPKEGVVGVRRFINRSFSAIQHKASRLKLNGNVFYPERRKAISRGQKKRFKRKVERERLSYLAKNRSVDHRRKIGAKTRERLSDPRNHPLYGKKFSVVSRKKMSVSRKKFLSNPKNLSDMIKGFGLKPNIFESDIAQFLDCSWKYVGDGTMIINGKCPDFVNIGKKKQVILANGLYWHITVKGLKTKKQAECVDQKPYQKLGYEVFFIWYDDWKALKTDEQKQTFIREITN